MPTSTLNGKGQWVPSIPEPYFLGRNRRKNQCGDCDRIFPTYESYRGHYALVHILAL